MSNVLHGIALVLTTFSTCYSFAQSSCSDRLTPQRALTSKEIEAVDLVLSKTSFDLTREKKNKLREIMLSRDIDRKSQLLRVMGYTKLVHVTRDYLVTPILKQGELLPSNKIKDSQVVLWAKQFALETGSEFANFSTDKVFFFPLSDRWSTVRKPRGRAIFIFDLKMIDKGGWDFSAGFNYGVGVSFEKDPAAFLDSLLIAFYKNQSEFSTRSSVNFEYLEKVLVDAPDEALNEDGAKRHLIKELNEENVMPVAQKSWDSLIVESNQFQ